MVRSVKAIGVACALGLSSAWASTDDAAALLQASVHGHAAAGGQASEILRDLTDAVVKDMQQVEATQRLLPMELSSQPGEHKGPIWHGVIFEREVANVEDGSFGELTFDHGCSKKDKYGDNYCEFPHGDKMHMKFQYRLSKPINAGYFSVRGVPKVLGVGGFIKAAQNGDYHSLTSRLNEVVVECPVCGPPCEAEMFGKKRTIELPPCPLPAGKNVTLMEMDIDLPYDQLLPLVKLQMQASFAMFRQEGEDTYPVTNGKVLLHMGRIYNKMPRMM